MSYEIDTINRTLPNTRDREIFCEKTVKIMCWLGSVVGKINDYQAEHQRLLDEAAATLQPALPVDIVMSSILSFLELPPYTYTFDPVYTFDPAYTFNDWGEDEEEDSDEDEETDEEE